MHVGLQVPNFTWPDEQGAIGDTFAAIAQRAERAGLYSFWVMDHFFQIGVLGPPEQEMLEGYSALAFAAGRTNRIKLGTMVTGVTYRYPGLLVKTVTTIGHTGNHCSQLDTIGDRKSTRLNSSHTVISYAVFCLKKKKKKI